jgi:hypothetical protein
VAFKLSGQGTAKFPETFSRQSGEEGNERLELTPTWHAGAPRVRERRRQAFGPKKAKTEEKINMSKKMKET